MGDGVDLVRIPTTTWPRLDPPNYCGSSNISMAWYPLQIWVHPPGETRLFRGIFS